MLTLENTHTITDLVRNARDEYADRVFLRYERNDSIYDVTYRHLAGECRAFAAWASDLGKELGHPVKAGLLGSASAHYIALMLGLMAGGAVAVPLDIQLDFETLADNLNRSDVDVLFYDWDYSTRIRGIEERCPGLSEIRCLQQGKNAACSEDIMVKYLDAPLPEVDVRPEDLAMILFTSGTTGKGKGVMLSHGNLIDNTFNYEEPEGADRDTCLNVLPIHHVFCITCDILTTARYGGNVALNPSISMIGRSIQRFQPTVIRMVPMMAKALYNRIQSILAANPHMTGREAANQVLGHRLKRIVCGGGYLTPELADAYYALNVPIQQGYGMSECAPKISAPDWSRSDKTASVGHLVERCQVRIVDGEIQVKSPSVMMGYYGDPENTKATLTDDGWLRTGDLGYLDDEDFLYLTGRVKNLIILSNGENVAPEELENMFDNTPLTEDVLIYGADDMLCAEVYPNFKYAEDRGIQDVAAAVEEFVQDLNSRLPGFKRILRVHVRKKPFKKTSSKKIIRSAFFEELKEKKESAKTRKLPENEVQNTIYELAAAQLGHRDFGTDTDLGEAGLDSLGSVMLLSALYDSLKLNLTLDDLMKNRTVLALESLYEVRKNEEHPDYTKRDVYPLTALQMYFAYVMRGNTTSNLPFCWKLDEAVDTDRLIRAVKAVFKLHPEMNDIIQQDTDGIFKNFRGDDREVDVPVISLTEREWQETFPTLVKPFMFTPGEKMYHTGIYQTEENRYFFFDLAHAIGDGMSLNVIFEDLNRLYDEDTPDAVISPEYTYYEYILDEMAKNQADLRQQNIDYYVDLMKDFHVRKSILTRRDCYNLEQGHNATLRNHFFRISRSQLRGYCQKFGVSENVVFLTAFNYCIGLFSNETDTVSSSIHSGRTDSRWNRLVGPLFETYFYRQTERPHEKVSDLLSRSADQILNTMRCYISTLHPDEMFFQYQGEILNIDTIGGRPAAKQPIQLDSLPFHLMVMCDWRGYRYELRYWENRFDREQLEVFMTAYEAVVMAMMQVNSVDQIRRQLPETIYPKHYEIRTWDLDRALSAVRKSRLLPNIPEDTILKVYVMDETLHKKPFGAWGRLYVMDHDFEGCTAVYGNPYGEGKLYETSYTARILPDGSLDLLEHSGRTIMAERTMGRAFPNLYAMEQTVCSMAGVKSASAYVSYGGDNALDLTVDIVPEENAQTEDFSLEKVSALLEEKLGKGCVPQVVNIR
ncbi:MAG: AMP-binding protein [Clostridium sp.]|nr:AMP-binding protein [Clostridium sp.]